MPSERNPETTVAIGVRFFARYAELVGTAEMKVELPGPATVGDAVSLVRQSVNNGERLPERPLTAVNREHALPDRLLQDGDVLAFLPPLAGG